MSSKSRKNGLQLILLLRLTVEILSCYFLPTECLGTMGTQKITSFCTCVTHRFPTKKLLWKSLKAFLKSTFAQLFYNPFYLFQVSMVLSAWKMAPLLRSKNCALPKILALLLDVSTCQNLCIPPPIQKVLDNKQIGKTIVCRCAILSFISRQTTKMRRDTVFESGTNSLLIFGLFRPFMARKGSQINSSSLLA